MRRHLSLCAALILALGSAICAPSISYAQPTVFPERNITIALGGPAGGVLDFNARLLARHLGAHIPGSPNINVAYMPGAGGKTLAAHTFANAPKNATWIAAVFASALTDPQFNPREKANYDPQKFIFLGSSSRDIPVCIARKDAKFPESEIILGITAPGGQSADLAILARGLGPLKIKLIPGYTGGQQLSLALERGEVQSICSSWAVYKVRYPGLEKGEQPYRILFQADPGDPELTRTGVPSLSAFLQNSDDVEAARLFLAQYQFSSPYLLPPGTDPARVEMLRKAFAETLSDKDFLTDAEKVGAAVSLMTGADMQSAVDALYRAQPDIIARVRQAMAKGGP
jgi:tripartite-type tricarboxylate transporter receptor subunit TctC